jgi:hypothetical protein
MKTPQPENGPEVREVPRPRGYFDYKPEKLKTVIRLAVKARGV